MEETSPITAGDRANRLLFKVLRSSHIFASAVRELLENRYLRGDTQAPLSISQIHLLKMLHLNGEHFVGQAAAFLGVSMPAASRNVDKLVRLGLVRRATQKDDRRVTTLKITPQGDACVRSFEERRVSGLRPVLERFSEQELRDLEGLLTRFVVSLIKNEGEGRSRCLRCGALFEESCPIHGVTGHCPYEQVRRTAPT